MIWDDKAYDRVLKEFRKGKAWLSDVSVEIEEGEAEGEPLTLLRIYEQQPTAESNNTLASIFCMKRRVVFRKGSNVIHQFFYSGGELAENFSKCPWLLDVLHQAAYAALIKKLTPPLEDSETEETR